jgi:3-phenylpropionate/trans-cinnamate dioxygenase ferredoxin component
VAPLPEPEPASGPTREPRQAGTATARRVDLLGLDEVPDGTMKMAWVDGTDPVLVVNVGGVVRAMQGICSHEYFELDKGFLTAGSLTCALHLSRFDLETGDPLDPPAEVPLVLYPVLVEDGRVLIEVPEGPLPVNE